MNFIVQKGTILDIVALSAQIPEFLTPYPLAEYQKRLATTRHLILIAHFEKQLIGFKVGYEKEDYFYT